VYCFLLPSGYSTVAISFYIRQDSLLALFRRRAGIRFDVVRGSVDVSAAVGEDVLDSEILPLRSRNFSLISLKRGAVLLLRCS